MTTVIGKLTVQVLLDDVFQLYLIKLVVSNSNQVEIMWIFLYTEFGVNFMSLFFTSFGNIEVIVHNETYLFKDSYSGRSKV